MRRSKVIVGLILVVAAMVVLTIIAGDGALQSSGGDRLSLNDVGSPRDVTSGGRGVHESAEQVDKSQSTRPEPQSSELERAAVEDDTASFDCDDEVLDLERLRGNAENDVSRAYSLLFEHLGMTQSERHGLFSLLVDHQVAGTHTRCKQGTKIDPQDRSDMIEAIIGPAKLARFLSLEQHMYEYGEIAFVDCVLNNNDSSLTDAQRHKLFEIIIEIAAREETLPGADAERGSIEYLEYRLAEMNERTRLFLGRVAGELSAVQVGYLFDEYQRISYRQADALERQKWARMDAKKEQLPLHYPARSCVPRK